MTFEIIKSLQTPKVEPVDVKEFIKDTELIEEFLKFANSHPKAVGLAANQVSVDSERLMKNFFGIRNLQDGSWSIVINPVIEYSGMKELKSEGCLTWQGKTIVAERYRFIKVSYYKVNGEKVENEIHWGFESQIWQHEANHLNGIEERVEESNFVLPKQIEPGRNEKCPCGSGKKYKQCCILQ